VRDLELVDSVVPFCNAPRGDGETVWSENEAERLHPAEVTQAAIGSLAHEVNCFLLQFYGSALLPPVTQICRGIGVQVLPSAIGGDSETRLETRHGGEYFWRELSCATLKMEGK